MKTGAYAELIPDATTRPYTGRVVLFAKSSADGSETTVALQHTDARVLWGELGKALEEIDSQPGGA